MKMKRFLALFLCLTMLLSLLPAVASADGVYIQGTMTDWNQNDYWQMTSSDRIHYSATKIIPENGKFKVVDGETWYGSYYANNVWEKDSDDNIVNDSGRAVECLIQYNAETHAITLTSPTDGYYVSGDMNGWGENFSAEAEYKMQKDAVNDIYFVDLTADQLPSGKWFKVVKFVLGKVREEYGGDGGSAYLTTIDTASRVYFYPGAGVDGWMGGHTTQVAAADTTNDGKYYIVGGFNEWSINSGFEMRKVGNSYVLDKEISFDHSKPLESSDQTTREYNQYKAVRSFAGKRFFWSDTNVPLDSANTSDYRRFTYTPGSNLGAVYLYAVTPTSSLGGSIEVDKTLAAAGETVAVTPTAYADYTFSYITVNGDAQEAGAMTFTMPAEPVTVTATFASTVQTSTIYWAPYESASGTVTLKVGDATLNWAQEVPQGTTVTVVAVPSEGYYLDSIAVKDENGDNILTTVDANNEFTMPLSENGVKVFASFAQQRTVSVASDIVGGTVTVDGQNSVKINGSKSVTIVVTPDAEYTFNSVSYAGHADIIASAFTYDEQNNTYTKTETFSDDATITASFTQKTYDITLTQPTGGQVAVDAANNKASKDDTVTITATPSAGYSLKHYIVNGNVQSENTFVMTSGGATVSAVFETNTVKIQNPDSAVVQHGSVTLTGTNVALVASNEYHVAKNTQVAIVCTPDSGYQLKADSLKIWKKVNDSYELVTASNPYSMTTGDAEYCIYAEFELIPPTTYAITKAVSPTNADAITTNLLSVTVSNAAVTEAVAGATVTVSATANPDDYWYLGSISVTKTASGEVINVVNGTFTMPAEDVTVTANYLEPMMVNLAFAGNGTGKVTVTVGGVSTDYTTQEDDIRIKAGATVSVTAVADTGCNAMLSEEKGLDLTTSFMMPNRDLGITATFTKIDYDITLPTGLTGGSVGVSGGANTANFGDTVTLTNNPATGYALVGYTFTPEGGVAQAVEGNTFEMPAANVTVSATFAKVDYTVTLTQPAANGTIAIVSGVTNDKAQYGDTITLSNTPAEGYQLKAYTFTPEGGEPQAVEGNTFNMPDANVTITAEFVLENGYYLVGPMNSWGAEATAADKMTEGEGGLFYIDTTLTSDEFKAALVTNGVLTMLPGEGYPSYSVTATGPVRVWLNPDGTDDAGWHCRYLRVENGYYLASSVYSWAWNSHPLTLENGVLTITAKDWPKDTEFKIVHVFNYGGQIDWFGTGNNGADNYSVSEGGTYTITFDREAAAATATLIEEAPTMVKAVAKNLELNGNIGINFKLVLPVGVDASKVVAQFYINGVAAGEGINLGGLTVDKDGYYVVKYEFAAKEVNQDVTLKVTVDGTPSLLNSSNVDVSADGITTSVKAMCDQYESSGMGAEVVTLAQKIEDYGAYASHYFSGTALPEGTTAVTTANDDTIKAKTRTKSIPDGVTAQVKLKSIYLTLESETTLNLRFEALENYNLADYTFWLGDTQLTPVGNVVKITNIAAKNLCTDYTVTVKSGETVVYTVTCSAMYYAKLVLNSTSPDATDALKNLMRALYLYWDAANAYFD